MQDEVIYGLYDSTNSSWLGNDQGVFEFRTQVISGQSVSGRELAVVSAQKVSRMLRRKIVVLPYDGSGKYLSDHINSVVSESEAVGSMEGEKN